MNSPVPVKTDHPVLDGPLVTAVLDYLGCPPGPPTLRYLNRLLHAYVRRVPWESVSRIVKRRATSLTADCPRWPEEFWRDAIRYGLGGTCFESNLAFFSLLSTLGFEGYMTVNDMGDSRACHASTVIRIDGHKYLVDNTLPIHSAVRFAPYKRTRRRTRFHDYTIRFVRENVYEVERSHHPRRRAFTLIDVPVGLEDYRAIVENDYLETGFFLTSVVITRVVGGKVWRFFSDRRPYMLESFNRAGKEEIPLAEDTLAQWLAGHFRMPAEDIDAALSHTRAPPALLFNR